MRTEPQRLHSLQSVFLKTVFPVVWIGGFLAATIALFSTSTFTDGNGAPPSPAMKWMFLAATVAGAAFIYWACIRLKLVRMDDQQLYVSNLLTDIQVPLSQVDTVTENRWLNIHPVTIHLRRETEFGSKIVFMPKVRWFAFWSEHPVVDEILEAVRVARGGAP
jgi:hypothetical protein